MARPISGLRSFAHPQADGKLKNGAYLNKKLRYNKEKLEVQDSLGPYWQKIFFALDFVLLARILKEQNKD